LRCEVCGHKIHDEPITAIIEGARLTVCVECSKHGKIIHQEDVVVPQKNLKKSQAPVSMVQRKPVVANMNGNAFAFVTCSLFAVGFVREVVDHFKLYVQVRED